MEVAGLNLLGGANGGGTPSTVGSGGGAGSLSTVSKAEVVEQDYVSGLSAEVSSSELDLGLGLSLGVGGCNGVKTKPCSWGEYGRILTAQDFPSIGGGTSGSSSSSSNSSGKPAISTQKSAVSGTKRAADSITQEGQGTVSQVVGWPPIRTYRINNLVNQSKNPAVDDGKMVVENCKNKDISEKKTGNGNVQKKGQLGTLFVKVNMDGVPIGRKLDLNAHACYETLAETLDDMFFYRPSTTKTTNFIRSNENSEAKKGSKLLGGSSEFVLTYEDKDGDWMLVGDVPWGMFLSTVKRLKIMRTSEANGLAPRFGGSNERPRNRPI